MDRHYLLRPPAEWSANAAGPLGKLADGSRGLVRSAALDELLDRDLGTMRGEALKKYEDTLDAVFCAYLAWHCWQWSEEGNALFGTLEHGYIVVPMAGA